MLHVDTVYNMWQIYSGHCVHPIRPESASFIEDIVVYFSATRCMWLCLEHVCHMQYTILFTVLFYVGHVCSLDS